MKHGSVYLCLNHLNLKLDVTKLTVTYDTTSYNSFITRYPDITLNCHTTSYQLLINYNSTRHRCVRQGTRGLCPTPISGKILLKYPEIQAQKDVPPKSERSQVPLQHETDIAKMCTLPTGSLTTIFCIP